MRRGADTENDLTIQFGGLVQATDRDGDTVTATGTVSVVVDDDTPIAVAGTSTGTSTRTGCRTALTAGPGDVGPGADGPVATGSVTALFQSGADVPLSYAFNTAGIDAGRPDVGRRCADLHDRGEPDHGDGRGGQHGVHDGAGRVDGSMDVHAGRGRSTMRRAPTLRTT